MDRNVYQYDDRFIAPCFGYRGAEDYYESNAAKHFLVERMLWIPGECYTAIDWPRLPMIEAVPAYCGRRLSSETRARYDGKYYKRTFSIKG
jgi:uncharacterized protein